jgi:hypothetical protein
MTPQISGMVELGDLSVEPRQPSLRVRRCACTRVGSPRWTRRRRGLRVTLPAPPLAGTARSRGVFGCAVLLELRCGGSKLSVLVDPRRAPRPVTRQTASAGHDHVTSADYFCSVTLVLPIAGPSVARSAAGLSRRGRDGYPQAWQTLVSAREGRDLRAQRRACSNRGSSRTAAKSSSLRASSRNRGNSSTDRRRWANVSSPVSPASVAKHA